MVEPAGRKKASSCWPCSFLTRSTEHVTSGLYCCGFYDNSREKESWSGKRLRTESEDGGGGAQELENAGHGQCTGGSRSTDSENGAVI